MQAKFVLLKKSQLTIADSYDPIIALPVDSRYLYSVSPLESFALFSWTELKWNIMQGCLNLILRKHQKKTQEVKNLTIMTFSLLWLLFSAFHRGNQASQSCFFWLLIVPENHTHRHKNAFTGFMFLLPLSHCMNLSCLWNYAYHALKLKFLPLAHILISADDK